MGHVFKDVSISTTARNLLLRKMKADTFTKHDFVSWNFKKKTSNITGLAIKLQKLATLQL